MNLERFNTLIKAIVSDADRNGYPGQLDQIIQSLENRINDPGNPAHAASVDQALIELRNKLKDLSVNGLAPTFRHYAKEYGLDLFVGDTLLQTVEKIIADNSSTITVTRDEIRKLTKKIRGDLDAVKSTSSNLDRFHVQLDKPDPGTAEMGILIPRPAVEDSLEGLGEELLEIADIAKVFEEIGTGSRSDQKITTLSTSDFSIFFLVDIETAKRVVDAISVLADGFKAIVKIKKTIADLKEQGVSEANLKGLVDHANGDMTVRIEKLSEEIIKDANGKVTKERRNELKIEVKSALTKMATKMDEGYYFEIQAAPPESQTSDSVTPEQIAALAAAVVALTEKQKTTPYLKDGHKPILSLPKPEKKTKKSDKEEKNP